MSNKQNRIKLSSEIIKSVLKTEARMDRFLLKQVQKSEVEILV